MKILVVSQYFWPESFLISDLVRCLVAEGHTVEVLTGKPNYPDGVIFEGYSAKGCMQEHFDTDIPVHRIPISPRGAGGGRRLLLNYWSYVWNGIRHAYRMVKSTQFDLIFVYVPSPIMGVIPAIYLKKRLKVPLVVWVQDLWPESLSATGFINNRWILKLAGYLVRWIYAASDLLLVQSRAFQQPMLKYVGKEKIIYYPNSSLDLFLQDVDEKGIPESLLAMLQNNFCLVFAGNLGTAQSLETLVEAAIRLRHLSDCKLILVGSGSLSGWLQAQIAEKKLDNLILAGRFPSTVMPALFKYAEGLLVTLKRSDIFTYTIPSKLQAYLAAGRPIIAAMDGEGARIIDEAGAGFCAPAEDAQGLAIQCERLYHLTAMERAHLGQSGRAYFLQHFEMVSQSRRLIDIFEDKLATLRS